SRIQLPDDRARLAVGDRRRHRVLPGEPHGDQPLQPRSRHGRSGPRHLACRGGRPRPGRGIGPPPFPPLPPPPPRAPPPPRPPLDPGRPRPHNTGLPALSFPAAAPVTAGGLAVAAYAPARWSVALGGAIVGGGIACMHYTGMSAVELPGRVTWWPGLVAVS